MIIKSRQINTKEDKAKAQQKAREKQRKKMIRTKYGQAPLKHSKKGVNSCCYAGIVVIILAVMLTASYITKGSLPVIVGFAGLASVIPAWLGVVSGIRGFKERDKNYITCKVGVVCNILLLLGLISIFFRGLFK